MRDLIADLEAIARDARALAADAKRRPAWSTLEPQLAAKISYAGIPQEKLRAGVFRGFVAA